MPVDLILDGGVAREMGDVAFKALPQQQDLEPALTQIRAETGDERAGGVVCVRVCTQAESAALNGAYRNQDNATNVLSFPAAGEGLPEAALAELDARGLPLGDLAICGAVVAAEAREQGKTVHDHCVHLFAHGVLHLLGMDHEDEVEAEAMEAIEVRVLARLDIADPYAPCK